MYSRPAVPVLRAKHVTLRRETPEQQQIRHLQQRIRNLQASIRRYKTVVAELKAGDLRFVRGPYHGRVRLIRTEDNHAAR